MEHGLYLEKALQHEDSKDVDAVDLSSELLAIVRRVSRCMSPQDVLNFILKNNLTDRSPNSAIALRILLTLLVSVAGGWTKLFKTKADQDIFANIHVLQELFVGLATLSIEHEIAPNIDLMELVKVKARKIKFWLGRQIH